MKQGSWEEAFVELMQSARAAVVAFMKQDIVSLLAAVGSFLILALPLLLVILVLWYLDSIGWRPDSGFYKIGALPGDLLAAARLAGFSV